MSTSANPGYAGTFTFAGVTLRVMSATVEEITDVNDASGIGNQFRSNLEGAKVLRGTAAGYALFDSAGTNGWTGTGIGQARTTTGVAFNLIPAASGTNGFAGTGIASSIRFGKDFNSNDTVSLSFVSSGTYTTT